MKITVKGREKKGKRGKAFLCRDKERKGKRRREALENSHAFCLFLRALLVPDITRH